MKRVVFLSVQTICLAIAFAQPQIGPTGPAAPTVPVSPIGPAVRMDTPAAAPAGQSPAQRRVELRSILQSRDPAPEQAVTERRLSPQERAELREQVREQYHGGTQR
ncbi:MAG: hypothetical protein ACREWJ_09220 [Rhodoferax sp.]